jgi:deazaflavin-dependent oxidoreductase (nitroreductase family)
MTQSKPTKNPPRGCSRYLWRLPILLYRFGLGGLLGDRMLLLEHTGRKSGMKRQAVIEVVRHDQVSGAFIIASGFGEKSDWYQNLLKTPGAVIQVGRKRINVTASRLEPAAAEDEILDYARRHPTAIRSLSGLMGYPLEETEDGYRHLGRVLPMIRLEPTL